MRGRRGEEHRIEIVETTGKRVERENHDLLW
jgi:hypothetical protein